MNRLRTVATLVLAFGALLLMGTHQRGNVAILEGHDMHRYSIELTRPLPPGRHTIGNIAISKLGTLPVTVIVAGNGEIQDIEVGWAKEVRPERLAFVSHEVYESDGKQIRTKGSAKCQLIHAAGQCMGCSQYIWVEVSMKTVAFRR